MQEVKVITNYRIDSYIS